MKITAEKYREAVDIVCDVAESESNEEERRAKEVVNSLSKKGITEYQAIEILKRSILRIKTLSDQRELR